MKRIIIPFLILLLAPATWQVSAQKNDPGDPKNIEKGKQLIQAIIEARGGASYLGFKTLVGSGMYTQFDKGASTIPQPFTDYIVWPDRERTEFGRKKKKDRNIQVNAGRTGWIYDGSAETLKDQNEKQVQSFLEGLEFDLDHILRGGWKDPEAKVWFYGREETRPGERADVVAIQLKNERLVLLLLDPATRLPLRMVYEKQDEQGLGKHEVRFFQYVPYDGVKFPNIVDFYRDGVQTARVNYDSVKLNAPVPDELFAKPASAKAIK
ncbi:MAG TPA: hypothetical protein VFD58_24900 [Blastocatellia bacterium]|nr:hypothetical protein [Blastocatellia bacterium]